MVQTAANISQEQYLQIGSIETQVIESGFTQFTENISNPLTVENVLFDKVATFQYRTRMRISFSISEEFKSHFVMIRGLMEFHRSNRYAFNYDAKRRTIETDIEINQLGELQSFFDNVLIWLKQELQFKRALKHVLEFESRYKVEMDAVYSLIHNIPSSTLKV